MRLLATLEVHTRPGNTYRIDKQLNGTRMALGSCLHERGLALDAGGVDQGLNVITSRSRFLFKVRYVLQKQLQHLDVSMRRGYVECGTLVKERPGQ